MFGLVRGQNNPKAELVLSENPALELVDGDLRDLSSLIAVVEQVQPDEVYNLGAISFVQLSFKQAELTAEITGLGVLRMLEAVRIVGGVENNPIRFYQASSSEMFGKVRETPQTERTPFHPRSPYGVAKVFGHHMTRQLPRGVRPARVVSGILFNHEGPKARARVRHPQDHERRSRASSSACRTRSRSATSTPTRDWGYAGDYVEAMWMMLQQDEPDDYVIATGETHTDPRVPRRRVPPRRLRRLEPVREAGPALRAAGRGRPAHGRRDEGRSKARAGRRKVTLRGARADDVREPTSRKRASAPAADAAPTLSA